MLAGGDKIWYHETQEGLGGCAMGKHYRIGLSVWGLAVYLLQLLPNGIWLLCRSENDLLSQNTSPYLGLEILEKASGILLAVLLILLKRQPPSRSHRVFWFLSMGFLCAYYAAWGCYFAGTAPPWLLVAGLAAMPPLCFAACAVWLRNYPALFPCAVFAAVHLAITCQTYR